MLIKVYDGEGIWWGAVSIQSAKYDAPRLCAHGKGVFYYDNGDVFNGKYQKDSKDGYGEYKYKTGNAYKGNWKHGQMDGWGMFMDVKSETIYDG